MHKTKLKVIATRVTEPLWRVIQEYLSMDAHVTPADFLRDAIREKLKRDAPQLYQKMFSLSESETESEPDKTGGSQK